MSATRRLAAILAVDVVGCSRLMAADDLDDRNPEERYSRTQQQ